MEHDVKNAFLRLTQSTSPDEVAAQFKADPRLFAPELDSYLISLESDVRKDGGDAGSLGAWRLVLRSLREGRNLYRSFYEFLEVPSTRAARDLVLAEPLLLEPEIDSLFHEPIRLARQHGQTDIARLLELRRKALAVFREQGANDGYFEQLADDIVRADPDLERTLVAENQDPAAEFQQFAERQLRKAVDFGDTQRVQRLVFASSLLGGGSIMDGAELPANIGDIAGRLASVFLRESNRVIQKKLLQRAPELIIKPAPFIAAGLLDSAINRARDELDATRVRELWLSKKLLLRCADVGKRDRVSRKHQRKCIGIAFNALEEGTLWPSHDEQI